MHRIRHQVEVVLERVEVDDERRRFDSGKRIADAGRDALHQAGPRAWTYSHPTSSTFVDPITVTLLLSEFDPSTVVPSCADAR